jgi:hypothetical protein
MDTGIAGMVPLVLWTVDSLLGWHAQIAGESAYLF